MVEGGSDRSSTRYSIQGSLMLRRGRGRGHDRSDKSLSHNQPRNPFIPPFPFHKLQYFDAGSVPSIAQNFRPRGLCNPAPRWSISSPRRMCNPVTWGLNNPEPRVMGFSYSGNSPRFAVPSREEIREPVQCHFIPSLPKPRPNTLTQEEWDVLNHNGRPTHGSVCAVVCCCTFGEEDTMKRIFGFCCGENSPSQHTEKKVIEQVIMLENGSGRGLRKMILISSRSPCLPCAQDMITFVKSRGFSMNLYFTALEEEIDPDRNGISLLATYGIPMRIADNYIWSYLTSLLAVCEGKPRTIFSDGGMVNEIYRKAWDKVWSDQLGAIMHQDIPNLLNSVNLLNKFNDVLGMMTGQAQRML